MKDVTQQTTDGFSLVARVKGLRSDQRGSISLLAGMMVFLATIFGIIAFDTNMAIYNRIIAQNAVDSAADSAALWQARACNMLQMLNNLHYKVNKIAQTGEGVSAAACFAATIAKAVATFAVFPPVVIAAKVAQVLACIGCDTLPLFDAGQKVFYKAIIPIQDGIVTATPFLVFGYANASAMGAGADDFINSVLSGVKNIASQIGISVPDTSKIFDISFPVHIYAVPLDPTSLTLYVEKVNSGGKSPWTMPQWVGATGNVFGKIGCSDMGYNATSSIRDRAISSMKLPSRWGWDDQYFSGHPGFMTWVAGKTEHKELLGLGNLKWLNGGQKSADEVSRVMYTGGIFGNGNLMIPGFIAIASSQVEGTTVNGDNGPYDAQGKLITVYFPSTTPRAGTSVLIYH